MSFFRHVYHAVHAGQGESWGEETNTEADAIVRPTTSINKRFPYSFIVCFLASRKYRDENNEKEEPISMGTSAQLAFTE